MRGATVTLAAQEARCKMQEPGYTSERKRSAPVGEPEATALRRARPGRSRANAESMLDARHDARVSMCFVATALSDQTSKEKYQLDVASRESRQQQKQERERERERTIARSSCFASLRPACVVLGLWSAALFSTSGDVSIR